MDTMRFESVPVPPTGKRERDRRYYESHREEKRAKDRSQYASRKADPKRREYLKEYRHNKAHSESKWETDASYLSRPFMAWDGEGITRPDGSHDYTMLAGKLLGTRPRNVYVEDTSLGGISTVKCLETLLSCAEIPGLAKQPIHVVYGGSYDVNMMLRDLPRDVLTLLYKTGKAHWLNYRLLWRPMKSFYVCRVNAKRERVGKGITLYDCVSFFQTSFIKACEAYLGEDFPHRDMIVTNKAARGTFTVDDQDTVRAYNDAELELLIALMTELRERLNKVGLRPRRWDGPGAVAASLLLREGVKDAMATCPPEVASAARYAYAGGRFEVVKFGTVTGDAYEYDVNSAYPSALRDCPDLNRGHWEHYDGDPGHHPFAIYRLSSSADYPHLLAPLFCRHENGNVTYPMDVTGWYWTPEYDALRAYCDRDYGTYQCHEAWVFVPDEDAPKPFAFIDRLYNKRRALKKAHDGAHVGIKLGLNSLYGKTAQQVGWRIAKDGTLKIPPFHQLEWAGYVTSHCRAAVLTAVLDNLEDVIAFETDAVFTTKPLPVTVGSELGDFELTRFTSLDYYVSGFYFGTALDDDGNPVEVVKTRGIDKGTVTRAEALKVFSDAIHADARRVPAKLTRFIGAGVALAQDYTKWRRWHIMDKNVTLEPTGKRWHAPFCEWCFNRFEVPLNPRHWHQTFCPILKPTLSAEFPVEWINPNPLMEALSGEEGRREDKDYELSE